MSKTIVDVEEARSIMGDNFLGMDSARAAGIEFSAADIINLEKVPFYRQTLQQYKDTHLLVAGASFVTINDINETWQATELFHGVHIFDGPGFGKKLESNWFLLQIAPLGNPGGFNREKMMSLGSRGKRDVAFLCEAVYAAHLYTFAFKQLLPAIAGAWCVNAHGKTFSKISIGPEFKVEATFVEDEEQPLDIMICRRPDLQE